MVVDRSKTPSRKKTERRKTGTAGQPSNTNVPESQTLRSDPQTMGRLMTQDEKVDEVPFESMDGSEAPAHSAPGGGGPKLAEDMGGVPDEDAIRRRAYQLWEADGRPDGRDEEFWYRAEREFAPAQHERPRVRFA